MAVIRGTGSAGGAPGNQLTARAPPLAAVCLSPAGLGFCQELNLMSTEPSDVVSTCNTIYGLLLQARYCCSPPLPPAACLASLCVCCLSSRSRPASSRPPAPARPRNLAAAAPEGLQVQGAAEAGWVPLCAAAWPHSSTPLCLRSHLSACLFRACRCPPVLLHALLRDPALCNRPRPCRDAPPAAGRGRRGSGALAAGGPPGRQGARDWGAGQQGASGGGRGVGQWLKGGCVGAGDVRGSFGRWMHNSKG